MNDIHREMQDFLKANILTDFQHPQLAPDQGFHPFITISREDGAGSFSLARTLLKAFEKQGFEMFRGWQILDNNLCEKRLIQTFKFLKKYIAFCCGILRLDFRLCNLY